MRWQWGCRSGIVASGQAWFQQAADRLTFAGWRIAKPFEKRMDDLSTLPSSGKGSDEPGLRTRATRLAAIFCDIERELKAVTQQRDKLVMALSNAAIWSPLDNVGFYQRSNRRSERPIMTNTKWKLVPVEPDDSWFARLVTLVTCFCVDFGQSFRGL